jgi:LmbE family N-acetylglucosaminyl deacetylase
MMLESDIIPFSTVPPFGERALVLAPHPDDETLGCGGTVRLLLMANKRVKVVFLTSGEQADQSHINSGYGTLREKEAEKALRVLGVSDYEFLRFPDRGLHSHYSKVGRHILKIAETYQPDTIYSPSMIEINPDHRASASLALDLQRGMMQDGTDHERPVCVLFYEVTTPLRPNMLTDISSVFRRKDRAIRKYRSQLRILDYRAYCDALNTFRALTVDGARRAEAFWRVDRPIDDEDAWKWLSYRTRIE